MEKSNYESFLVNDEGQGSKYPPLKVFPPDQEITCQYLGDIPPFPQYFQRGEAPLEGADTFTRRIVASLPFLNGCPIQLPLQGLLKDTFSSDPHENFYDGAVKECEPELDRLCVPNIFRKRTLSVVEAELNLLASNLTPKKFYAVANFVEPKPELDLPASISFSKRLSFAAQNFLDPDEPEEPQIASASTTMKSRSLSACLPCHKRIEKDVTDIHHVPDVFV